MHSRMHFAQMAVFFTWILCVVSRSLTHVPYVNVYFYGEILDASYLRAAAILRRVLNLDVAKYYLWEGFICAQLVL